MVNDWNTYALTYEALAQRCMAEEHANHEEDLFEPEPEQVCFSPAQVAGLCETIRDLATLLAAAQAPMPNQFRLQLTEFQARYPGFV